MRGWLAVYVDLESITFERVPDMSGSDPTTTVGKLVAFSSTKRQRPAAASSEAAPLDALCSVGTVKTGKTPVSKLVDVHVKRRPDFRVSKGVKAALV